MLSVSLKKSVREKKGNLIDSSSESDKEFQPEDVPSDSNDATSLSKDATSPSKDALREQIRMLQEKLNSSKAGVYKPIYLVGILIDASVLMILNCFR